MAHVVTLSPNELPGRRNGFFARLRQAVANYREYRRVYEELDALSDRELADLGMSRHSIRDIASAAAYGR